MNTLLMVIFSNWGNWRKGAWVMFPVIQEIALIGCGSRLSNATDPITARQAKRGGGASVRVGKEHTERAVSAQQRLRQREESRGIRVGLVLYHSAFGNTFIFLSEGRLKTKWIFLNKHIFFRVFFSLKRAVICPPPSAIQTGKCTR